MEKETIVLHLLDDSNLELEKAVCNHGFFMMAPNKWFPDEKSLVRPLSFSIDNNANTTALSVTVSIRQPPKATYLIINYHLHNNTTTMKKTVSTHDEHIQKSIKDQVSRMLRISERDERHLHEFYRIHPQANKQGFGRIIRAPTIFEDIVKSFLICNCQWSRSLEMAQALCDLQFKTSNGVIKIKRTKDRKRKRSATCTVKTAIEAVGGNFPSPQELASLDEQTLNKYCNLGYRASCILKVAQDFSNRNLNLAQYFELETNSDKLMRKLMNIGGFGPFSVANIMMCLGFYHRVPIDTETIKHVQKVHGKTNINKKNQTAVIAEIYDKYAPYQCLAYWLEHVEYYEKIVGKLSKLPHLQYGNVVTPKMIKTKSD